jgi:hypothetical protein
MELHTLRVRLTAGLRHNAERGDLALVLPIGLVRDQCGKGQKTPDLAVQQRLERIFATFLHVRPASKVLQRFKAQHLTIPGRDRFGALEWKTPTISAITAVLKNPA